MQAKLAFEIPERYEVEEDRFAPKIPDTIIDKLLELFPGAEFVAAGVCWPNLFIIDTHEVPTPEMVAEMKQRIASVLKKMVK